MTAALFRQARPKQWVKNLLVFAAPGAAGVLDDGSSLWRAVVIFVAFCLASSGTYFWNDLLDADNDRNHPTKQHRPIASGAIPMRHRPDRRHDPVVAGIGLAATTRWQAAVVVAGYVVLTSLYSTVLKHIAVVDLDRRRGRASCCGRLRGAVATDVQMSKWFSLTTSFASLFIVAGKRYAELRDLGDDAQTRSTLDDYSLGLPAHRAVGQLRRGDGDLLHLGLRHPRGGRVDVAVLRVVDHPDGDGVAALHADPRAGPWRRARGDLCPRSGTASRSA